jgi:hypothetical protein
MRDFKEMTPIELNILVNKTNENYELTKSNIYELLDKVNELKKDINSKLKIMEGLEFKYVEMMQVLIEKQELMKKQE